MPEFFWCSPVFHPQDLFLAPTPPLLGLLLALREAAWFHSEAPFTHTDFPLPPSHHISPLHKVTNSQLVTVSVSKNWVLFFRGWVFILRENRSYSKYSGKEGRANSERISEKERGRLACIVLEGWHHLDLSLRITILCVINWYVYNILSNWERFYLPLLNLNISTCTKEEENSSDVSTFTFLTE